MLRPTNPAGLEAESKLRTHFRTHVRQKKLSVHGGGLSDSRQSRLKELNPSNRRKSRPGEGLIVKKKKDLDRCHEKRGARRGARLPGLMLVGKDTDECMARERTGRGEASKTFAMRQRSKKLDDHVVGTKKATITTEKCRSRDYKNKPRRKGEKAR